jgi:uncharacterized protein (DUF1330 family)
MSVYFVANIRINDRNEYQNYLDRADLVFAKYKGTYLAVDKQPMVLEGEWNYDRAVLIRFDNKVDFDLWYASAEYQEILQHRLSAAKCDAILMEGK